MAKSVTLFNVFVASPSDLAEERDLLSDVISELNHTTAKLLSIKLELIRWETNTFPSFGDDAQDVINKQIEDDYDIFIGIMGARFGSPTNRFGSGTLEEFNRAYDKYEKNLGKTKIMMYFKNVTLSLNDIDIVQIQQIQSFKKSLGPKGGLYQEYDKAFDFKDLIRNHLNLLLPRLVDEYNQQVPVALSGEQNESLTVVPNGSMGMDVMCQEEDNEEFEEGYLDSLLLINEYFSKIEESAGRITLYMVDMSTKLNKGVEKIKKIADFPEKVRVREARKMIDKTADDIMLCVNKTNLEIPVYRSAVTIGFNSYSNAYVKYRSFAADNEELEGIEVSKNSLRDAVNFSLSSLRELKEVVINLPAMTSKLVQAKKEYTKTINQLMSEFEFSLSLLDDIDSES